MKDVKFNAQELADVFQVEELEKRYEMGWVKAEVTPDVKWSQASGFSAEISVKLSF
ncbi:MAG: hypothetical protein LBO74_13970 [Candidatus Symbiothrix sp.]|jgi:hypothetical protein|nr:hypothetical protein [Candidatus Symbiothrix sp.]